MSQKIIIFDGPDGVGKTEISKELSRRIAVPYFKMTTEHENWRKGTFIDALRFDQTYLAEFLKQTNYSIIIDRAFPSEAVYAKVFSRKTDDAVLRMVDEKFAAMGTLIVIPLRHDYSDSREDEVIPRDRLREIHDEYLRFSEWTKCDVIQIYVDDFDNDLDKEINELYVACTEIDRNRGFDSKRRSVVTRWRGTHG